MGVGEQVTAYVMCGRVATNTVHAIMNFLMVKIVPSIHFPIFSNEAARRGGFKPNADVRSNTSSITFAYGLQLVTTLMPPPALQLSFPAPASITSLPLPVEMVSFPAFDFTELFPLPA